MNRSTVIAIISIASVLLFFIITYALPGAPAWLVFIAAGLGIVIASSVMKDDSNKKDDIPDVQIDNEKKDDLK